MLTAEQRVQLISLGWSPALDNATRKPIGGHRIQGKVCYWWDGPIHGVDQSAWITDDGGVFLHRGADMDLDEFVRLLTVPPVSTRARGLFDLTEVDE